jgi:hypothetical protein
VHDLDGGSSTPADKLRQLVDHIRTNGGDASPYSALLERAAGFPADPTAAEHFAMPEEELRGTWTDAVPLFELVWK